MKKAVIVIVALFTIIILSGSLFSQSFDIGPRGGMYMEDTDFFLGAQADIELLNILGLHLVPYVDYIFVENIDTQWLFGANVLYDVVPLVVGSLYIGGGVGIMRSTFDVTYPEPVNTVTEKETDSVINFLSGIRFNAIGIVEPFANARLSISDNTSIVFEGGVHFNIF